MPCYIARGHDGMSTMRALANHVFAYPKDRGGLRTIGLANLAYNFLGLIVHESRSATA